MRNARQHQSGIIREKIQGHLTSDDIDAIIGGSGITPKPVPVQEEDDMKVQLCQVKGTAGVYAVSPMGCWKIPNQQALKDFAFQYGFPTNSAGLPAVEQVANNQWWGPRLDQLGLAGADVAAGGKA